MHLAISHWSLSAPAIMNVGSLLFYLDSLVEFSKHSELTELQTLFLKPQVHCSVTRHFSNTSLDKNRIVWQMNNKA